MISNLLMKLAVAFFVLSAMAGCGTTTKTNAPTSDFCMIQKRISWSKHDTDQTILEIKQSNAALKAVCGKP